MKYVNIIKAESNKERAKKVTSCQAVTESNTLNDNNIMGFCIYILSAPPIAKEGSEEERRWKEIELIREHTNCHVYIWVQPSH